MKDPSYRFCQPCAKRTVHRKHRQTRREGGDYVWVCASCCPRQKGEQP